MQPLTLLAAFVATPPRAQLVRLTPVDIAVIAIYFAIVIYIGFYLKGVTNTSEDFFMAGREMTAWIAGLSFVSANLGSLELMGWAGAAYQYGILAAHWYWIGAIPAMLFLGIIMMPFYYITKMNSVPGYLNLRYGKGTRALSGHQFRVYDRAHERHQYVCDGPGHEGRSRLEPQFQHLAFDRYRRSLCDPRRTALRHLQRGPAIPAHLGGRASRPYPWSCRSGRLAQPEAPDRPQHRQHQYVHLWSRPGLFSTNSMGVNWVGIVFGLGLVISFGYWTTDFLVVQRVLSAKDLRSARMAPIIGAGFKMLIPFFVILPGLLAISVLPFHLVGQSVAVATGQHSYNEVLPLMLVRYCGPGLLGLGVTALIAGFMSGMAGNVSAFSTVWTYDIYGAFIKKDASDEHYVAMGRWSMLIGVLISSARPTWCSMRPASWTTCRASSASSSRRSSAP